MTTFVQHVPDSRWISVVFLQGEEADAILEMIDRAGLRAAIEYLQRWDFGDETTEAALENGYVYDAIPAGSTDRTIHDDGGRYALTYSAQFGYVSLLRSYEPDLEPTLAVALERPATAGERAMAEHPDQWFSAHDLRADLATHSVTR
ncbi:hypothetical protein [Agromyces albus]|uniref:Uncharacterized protein n=1 Tax=Agromyces albus TaxID=205332 RepID=A0A4Q2KRL4_9MICO|nr:hypothetical protein [Agromyces albus]RXZ68084.1 hypothetical protein ESP51_15110 [Agromyces albus]